MFEAVEVATFATKEGASYHRVMATVRHVSVGCKGCRISFGKMSIIGVLVGRRIVKGSQRAESE